MNKILVEIYIPAIGEHFDMLVPGDVLIQDVIGVIADGVAELTNERYVTSHFEQLCMKEPEGLLHPMLTLHDYGVKDGTRLYLL